MEMTAKIYYIYNNNSFLYTIFFCVPTYKNIINAVLTIVNYKITSFSQLRTKYLKCAKNSLNYIIPIEI